MSSPSSPKITLFPVTIIREGRRIETTLNVSSEENGLIRAVGGEKPRYFIYGPLVFSPARLEGMASYARVRPSLENMQSPLFTRIMDTVEFPGEELVVVTSPFFAHKITKGYGDPLGQVVKQINGVPVKNLRQLVELLRDCKDQYLTIRFAEEGAETLIFRRDEIEKATDEILEDNGINPTRRRIGGDGQTLEPTPARNVISRANNVDCGGTPRPRKLATEKGCLPKQIPRYL